MQRPIVKVISVTTSDLDAGNAYADGDGMTAAFEITNAAEVSGGSGVIQSVTVFDKDKEKKSFDILLFNAEPTIASAINAALDITDAEMTSKYVGTIAISNLVYRDINAGTTATSTNNALAFQCADGKTSLWAVLMAKEAATYTAATDLVLKFGISAY